MPDITVTIPPAYVDEVVEALEAEHARPDGLTDLQFGQFAIREKLKDSVRGLRYQKRAIADRATAEADQTEIDGAL